MANLASKKVEVVEVRTPNVANRTSRVNAVKYEAMRKVLLRVMPKRPPGITQAEMMAAVRMVAQPETFPGTTYQWWAKTVQLDLEVRGELTRVLGKPLRWHRR